MRKIYATLALLFAIGLSFSTRSYAYNFTMHFESDTCSGVGAGGSVSYYYQINTAGTGLSVTTFFGDGTSSSGSLLGNYGYNWHQFGLPGIYTVKHVLYQSGHLLTVSASPIQLCAATATLPHTRI